MRSRRWTVSPLALYLRTFDQTLKLSTVAEEPVPEKLRGGNKEVTVDKSGEISKSWRLFLQGHWIFHATIQNVSWTARFCLTIHSWSKHIEICMQTWREVPRTISQMLSISFCWIWCTVQKLARIIKGACLWVEGASTFMIILLQLIALHALNALDVSLIKKKSRPPPHVYGTWW